MKLDSLELRLIRMELVTPFETSFSVQTGRDVLLVGLHADGLIGWGECTAGRDPFYSSETTSGSLLILREFMLEGLRNGRILCEPEEYFATAGYIRGNNMAHAALEAALWDLKSQQLGKPLAELLGGTRKILQTGVSVGIQKNVEQLVAVVGEYARQGYQRIKIKIKPGWDVAPVMAIREALGDVPLMVDANCAYSLADLPVLQKLDRFELMMIEQPFAYTDIVDHAELQKQIETPVCLDESITDLDSVRAAIALQSCRIVNIKQGRVGGICAAREIHDYCQKHDIPVWAGGMLETGIGRSLNIALASLENFSLPGDVSASDRYWQRDIIDPPVTFKEPGSLEVPSTPGRGYEVDMDYLNSLTTHKEVHNLG